jgi:EAL domain-containing protein (putative c-di-GMP-specific phosphodiesterase class I)
MTDYAEWIGRNSLDINVLAEGVETKSELARLINMGCPLAEG